MLPISNSFSKLIYLSVFAVSTALLLSGCSVSGTGPTSKNAESASYPADKIKLVAAENFYGEAAKAVGGDYVEIISILNNPDTDPHDFEPTPEASKSVHDAQIAVYNGIG